MEVVWSRLIARAAAGIAAAAALLLLEPAAVHAQQATPDDDLVLFEPGVPVRIVADTLEFDQPRKLYVARGRVRITQEGRELQADWIAFSNVTRRGVASGGVVFSDGVDTVYTEFIEFDIDTLEGVMFEAEFDRQRGQMELRGKEVAKTGEQTYHFREGEFTTCQCPDDDAREPWQIKAREADLELEGYGTARNTTFEVLGIPIAWMPWMMWPLKTERQTGLLFPHINISGRNGFEFGLPVFIAAGDPVNLTVTPYYLSKRGFKGDLGIDYVVGQESGGQLFGAYLPHDSDVDANSRRTPFRTQRWGTSGTHDFFLEDDVRLKARYVFVSDNSYTNDFDEFSRYREDRYLPSRVMLEKPFGPSDAFGFLAGAQYSDDQQNPDDTDRDAFVLNRLPEAQLQALPQSVPLPWTDWLVPSLGLRYARYDQEDRPQNYYTDDLLVTSNGRFFDTGRDGIPTGPSGDRVEQGRTLADAATADPNADNFDAVSNPTGTEGDGLFQEGELMADSGQRALVTPRLGAAFRLFDAVEVFPEVGWHETLYQSAAQGFERRGMLTGRLDVRTRLRRDFGSVSHLIEPRLGWAYVERVSQSGNPLYVPATAVPQVRIRELDLENLTRDWADRIRKQNLVTVGVGNRVYRDGAGAGIAPMLLADVVLQAGYDIARSEFANVYLDGRSYPIRGMTTRFSVGFDPEHANVDEALVGLGWSDDRGDRANLGYRYLRDVPEFFEAFPEQNDRFDGYRGRFSRVHQIDGGFRIAINPQWALLYGVAYSFERKLFLGNGGGVEYISRCRCWAVRVQLRDNRTRGPSVSFEYMLIGVGDDSRNPFENRSRTGIQSFVQ